MLSGMVGCMWHDRFDAFRVSKNLCSLSFRSSSVAAPKSFGRRKQLTSAHVAAVKLDRSTETSCGSIRRVVQARSHPCLNLPQKAMARRRAWLWMMWTTVFGWPGLRELRKRRGRPWRLRRFREGPRYVEIVIVLLRHLWL